MANVIRPHGPPELKPLVLEGAEKEAEIKKSNGVFWAIPVTTKEK